MKRKIIQIIGILIISLALKGNAKAEKGSSYKYLDSEDTTSHNKSHCPPQLSLEIQGIMLFRVGSRKI